MVCRPSPVARDLVRRLLRPKRPSESSALEIFCPSSSSDTLRFEVSGLPILQVLVEPHRCLLLNVAALLCVTEPCGPKPKKH